MTIHLGDVPANITLYIPFASYNSSGASVTMTGFAVTDIEIYKNGSVTQRASDAGYVLLDTDGTDFDALTGVHGFSVDLSNDTTAGFFSVGGFYWVVVSSVTVDGQTVNFVAATFRIVASESTAGYPRVGVAFVNNVATTSVTAVNANQGTTQPINFTGTGASATARSDVTNIATAAVSTSTAQIGVNAVQAGGTAWESGAITAASIAADAIGASELAADAASEIGTAVWATAARTLTAGTNIALAKGTGVTGFNDITAAQAATGVWQDATAGDFTVASSIGKGLYVGNIVPGAAGGHFIAGTNAATTITTALTTTFTGNLTGSVASVSGAVGSVTGAVGSVTGAVGSVTGAVGSVTGNVGGTINGLTATALADFFDTDSLTTYGASVAGSVVQEIADNAGGGTPPTASAIADAVWDEDATAHQTLGTFGQAIGDPVANSVTMYAAVVTDAAGANVAADVIAVKADTAAILIDTNELQTDDYPTTIAAVKADTAAILIDTGTTLDAALAVVDANVDAILVDTAEIGVAGAGLTNINLPNQTMDIVGDITGNLSGTVGSVTGAVGSVAAGGITASSIAADAIGASELAADAVAEIADAVHDEVVAGSTTLRQMLRGFTAALLGKASGLETATAVYRNIADTMPVITATVDADGNRTAVTLDLDDTP